MASHIHALREALVEVGLLPETTDYRSETHANNYSKAWDLQIALLSRGYPIPATPRKAVDLRG